MDVYLPCFYSFIACMAVCLVFNVRGKLIFFTSLGGAIGWFVYLLCRPLQNDIVQFFIATVVITIYSEVMARIRRCPVTGYLQVALLPLVPGAGIYYTMQYCVEGETQLFLSTLLHTFGFAAALSVGAMLATSVLRTLLPRLHWGGR